MLKQNFPSQTYRKWFIKLCACGPDFAAWNEWSAIMSNVDTLSKAADIVRDQIPYCREGLGGLVRHGSFKMLLNCSYWSQDTFREQFKVSHVMVIVKLEPPGRGHWPMLSTWPLRPLIMWIRQYCSDLCKLNAEMCLLASETIFMTIIQTEDTL